MKTETTPVNRKIYKVVNAVCLTSQRSKNAVLVSAYAPSFIQVEYKVGKPAFPRVEGTKLFGFTCLKDARRYIQGASYRRIYVANATGVYHNGWLNHRLTLDQVVRAFRGEVKMEKPSKDFASTVVCDSITLLREIKPPKSLSRKVKPTKS